MIGQTFGRWTVIASLAERQNGKRVYLCRCACGYEGARVGGNLRSGISKSCGCYKRELIHAAKYRHGRNASDRTYNAWVSMNTRCSNPNNHHFHNYGGRGIRVCERWARFENFLSDMGEVSAGLSLDRINNDGNYEPANCRWATAQEQVLNKTTTRYVTAFGKTQPLAVWAREFQVDFLLIWKRLARGWTAERALTEQRRTATNNRTKRAAA